MAFSMLISYLLVVLESSLMVGMLSEKSSALFKSKPKFLLFNGFRFDNFPVEEVAREEVLKFYGKY